VIFLYFSLLSLDIYSSWVGTWVSRFVCFPRLALSGVWVWISRIVLLGFGSLLGYITVRHFGTFRAVQMTVTYKWRNSVADFDSDSCHSDRWPQTAALEQQLCQWPDNCSDSDSPNSFPWPCLVNKKSSSFCNVKSGLVSPPQAYRPASTQQWRRHYTTVSVIAKIMLQW